MKTYRIRPLPLAWMDLDLAVLTYRYNYGDTRKVPIYAWYIEGADQHILVDTGAEAAMATQFRGLASEPIASLEEALAEISLTPDDIDLVIHTHLQWDHCGNTLKCKNAKLLASETEYKFSMAPHPILAPTYKKELLKGLTFTVVDGHHEVAPGIEIIPAPGHTPGTVAVSVNTEKGKAIITGFCCTRENFEIPDSVREYQPLIPPGIHLNAVDGFESAIRIKGMADILIPVHDPAFVGMKSIP